MNTAKGSSEGKRPKRQEEWEPIEAYEARVRGQKEPEETADLEYLDEEDALDEEPVLDDEDALDEEPAMDKERAYAKAAENGNITPKRIALFAGLLVLAVLICIPLWSLTHKKMNQKPENNLNSEEGQTELPEDMLSGEPDTSVEPDTPVEPNAPVEPDTSGKSDIPEKPDTSTEPEAPDISVKPEAPTEPEIPDTPTASANPEAEAPEPISGDTSMRLTAADDYMTAKDVTNLRSEPSTLSPDNIVGQLRNGEALHRTGFNADTGWSALEYNGETVYAVTRYLTTDLSYETPKPASNPNRVETKDGRIILFTDCDDSITPKEYVNLRTEPSTSEGNATVSCQLNHGEQAHRTGYSPDAGWSRVEYDGKILYVVSSYVEAVAEE